MAADYSYHVLAHPFPDGFAQWYPYTRAEVLGEDNPWLRWLRRVMAGLVPGVNDRMIAARREATSACLSG